MHWQAIKNTLYSRRFWVWQIGGAAIYAIPATIRLTTAQMVIPFLPMIDWIGYWIPGNLFEKILVNAFFPGAAGAIAGEILYTNLQGTLTRREKYLARLRGALFWTALWSLLQLTGVALEIKGTYGSSLFEYPMVYPLNFLLASLSIFTPTVLYFVKNQLANAPLKRSSSQGASKG